MPGPAPKRDAERRRTNTPVAQKAELYLPEPIGPERPDSLDEDSIGGRFYDSLRISGQAVFYTASDWVMGEFVARSMNKFEETGNGQILTAILRGVGQLMVTEGERRKVRLELERGAEQSDDPTDNEFMNLMAQFKD